MTMKKPCKKRIWLFFAAVISLLLGLGLFLNACPSHDPAQAQASARQTFQPISKGKIDVDGGLVHLAARRDGVVEKVFVKEGDLVRAGQTLASLEDEQQRLALQVAQGELDQTRATVEVIRRQIGVAQKEAKRLKTVLPAGAVTELEYEQAQGRLEVLHAQLKEAKAAADTSRRRPRQAAYELERSLILAPVDGMIVRHKVRAGDGVSTLNVTPLFVFAPHNPLIVRAELDEKFLNAVKAGDWAQVVPEADESKAFRARVRRVGKVFGQQHLSQDDPTQRQDLRVLEVELAFPQSPDLLIGQRVRVRYMPEAPRHKKAAAES